MSISTIISSVKTWLTSNWAAAGGVFILLLGLVLLAGLGWRNSSLQSDLDTARAERDAARADYGREAATSEMLRGTAKALAERNAAHNDALGKAEDRKEYLTGRNTYLYRRLQEAKNANSGKDFVLDVADVDNLCLLVLTAEGCIPGDYVFPGPGESLAGRGDPFARYCATWHGLTAQGAVTWIARTIGAFGELKSQVRAARECNR